MNLKERVDRHEEILRGDGNGQSGLIIKVDRHDQQLATYRKVAWIVLAAVVAEFFTVAGILISQAVKANP